MPKKGGRHTWVDAQLAAAVEQISALGRIIDERDRRYTELRSADDKALTAALASAEKAVAAALAAADRATQKSEDADTHYRAQQNEWRATISEILATATPLATYNTAQSALVDRITQLGETLTASVAAQSKALDDKIDVKTAALSAEMANLRASRDAGIGQSSGMTEAQRQQDRARTNLYAVLGVAVSALFVSVSLYLGLHKQPVTVISQPPATTATTVR